MIFEKTPLAGAYLIHLQPHIDERGYFARTWCAEEFEAKGIESTPVQCNASYSAVRGTLRGLHWQDPPHQETKLIRCVRGSLFDVIVDIRPDSTTYREWFGAELSEDNLRMMLVPEGFAHGFVTLQDATEVTYQVTARHARAAERTARWNEPAFGIDWPIDPTTMSEKDRTAPDFHS